MTEAPIFSVHWWFRNDHAWQQSFASKNERDFWVNSVGLISHPDIVRVTVYEGDSERDLKRVA